MSRLAGGGVLPPLVEPAVTIVPEHTVEIVSDSGEGAQKCGQIFGAVSAKMGNGVWTVEIIPAEVQPPPRIPEGASGNRIRIGTAPVTNWGDVTNLVVAFNEQVLLARHRAGALAPDAILLVEDLWASHDDAAIRAAWTAAMEELSAGAYRILPVPMEAEALRGRTGRLATFFDFGEYALWHFGPALQVSTDGRRETLYRDATFKAHLGVVNGTPIGLETLEAMNADYAWLPAWSPARSWLESNGYRIDVMTDHSFVASRMGKPPLTPWLGESSGCFPGP